MSDEKHKQIVKDNPDLPLQFVKDAVKANDEVKAGLIEPYIRRISK